MKYSKNILAITYWSFKEGLIQTYTLPYLRLISENLTPKNKIYLITFEKPNLRLNQLEKEEAFQALAADNIEWISFDYSKPGIKTYLVLLFKILKLATLLFRFNIGYIHTFCTPAGSLGYLLSLIGRKKLVLDSFEPHAESMVENGTWRRNDIKFRILNFFENRQVRKAEFIIGTTKGVYEYVKVAYHFKIPENRFFVKPACVNLQQFKIFSEAEVMEKRNKLGLNNKVIAVYAGKLGGIYYDIEVFEFLKTAYDYWKGNFVFLMLTNTPRKVIDEFALKVGLNPKVIISKFVLHDEVAGYLALGDFGLTPVKSVPTKRYCTPIKDGEYWALGLPVVITPNISDDSEIIEYSKIGTILSQLNTNGYLDAVKAIDIFLKKDKQYLQQKIRKVAIQYRSFDIAKNVYKNIYLNDE